MSQMSPRNLSKQYTIIYKSLMTTAIRPHQLIQMYSGVAIMMTLKIVPSTERQWLHYLACLS